MKTNPIARGILRIRVIVFCLAIVGMAVIGFNLGESLTVQYGLNSTSQVGYPQAPNVSLADAMAAVRY
jgi:hypothetical protein